MNKDDNIAAVIVTYNPPGYFLDNLEKIKGQVEKIFIIDNGSNGGFFNILEDYTRQNSPQITLIRNDANIGLAAAQNQGIAKVLKGDSSWILLLDHDSTPDQMMVKNMLLAYKKYERNGHIGIIAPNIREREVSETTHYLTPKGIWFSRAKVNQDGYIDNAITVIASGSLVKREVFEKIGLMTEKMFIDYVDHDFCLRAKTAGFDILVVGNAILHHSLGAKKTHKFLGKTINVTHYSPIRKYYMYRNRVAVWKKYYMKFPSFVTHDVMASFFDIICISLFEKEKIRKMATIARAIKDGLFFRI